MSRNLFSKCKISGRGPVTWTHDLKNSQFGENFDVDSVSGDGIENCKVSHHQAKNPIYKSNSFWITIFRCVIPVSRICNALWPRPTVPHYGGLSRLRV